MWTFVFGKLHRYWLWYVYDKENKSILCWHIGGRTNDDLAILLSRLGGGKIFEYCTDKYKSYESALKNERHIIGKKFTQNIERQNLNFRLKIKRLQRKTIAFSKCPKIHEKVISMFIEKYYFKPILITI